MKVLLVKTSSMGDVIHTYPAITEALRQRPDLVLDWCVEDAFLDLARLHTGVRAAYAVRMRAWARSPLARTTLAEVRAFRAKLRSENYDLVLDAQGLMKSAFVAKLAGASVSGFDTASAREPIAPLLYNRRHRVPRTLHAISRTRLLFGSVLGYRPNLEQVDSGLASAHAATPTPRAFLLHGTTWPSKKWPLPDWIALAAGLKARGLTPVTSWASEEERQVADAIHASVPETVVLPKSPLSSIAVEIERSALVVGVDTGLMHLADAYRRPTIALFLGSSPGLTGPVGPESLILPEDARSLPARPRRRDRGKAASATVTPDEVLQAADRLLLRDTGP